MANTRKRTARASGSEPLHVRRDLYKAKYGSYEAADARLAEKARQDAIDAAERARKNRRVLDADVAEQKETPASNGSWPWGSHETKLLQSLAAAAKKFWVNYDPNDPDTAPINDIVSNWLQKEHAVSRRVADVIAQILRPKDLRPGRKKSK